MNMKMTLLDKSNYFRGLLLLAAKDKKLSPPEIDIIKEVGKKLSFEKSFYEEAIRNLLENEHISNDPPKFSNENVTKNFLSDGLKLALSDTNLDPDELIWLKQVAFANNISNEWFSANLKTFIEGNKYKEPLAIVNE